MASQTPAGSSSQRRRLSATPTSNDAPTFSSAGSLRPPSQNGSSSAASSSLAAVDGFDQPLPAIPGSPSDPMTLSRSPSPQPGGGWTTPGLAESIHNDRNRSRSPAKKPYGDLQTHALSWEAAKAQSAQVKAYSPVLESHNRGFFKRHIRSLSSQLPQFYRRSSSAKHINTEKASRGGLPQSREEWKSAAYVAWRISYRWRRQLLLLFSVIILTVLFYVTRESSLHP